MSTAGKRWRHHFTESPAEPPNNPLGAIIRRVAHLDRSRAARAPLQGEQVVTAPDMPIPDENLGYGIATSPLGEFAPQLGVSFTPKTV